jgi:hypothetical protein
MHCSTNKVFLILFHYQVFYLSSIIMYFCLILDNLEIFLFYFSWILVNCNWRFHWHYCHKDYIIFKDKSNTFVNKHPISSKSTLSFNFWFYKASNLKSNNAMKAMGIVLKLQKSFHFHITQQCAKNPNINMHEKFDRTRSKFQGFIQQICSFIYLQLKIPQSNHAWGIYYAMKSKNFLMLIIDLNNVHEFSILRYILWILSKKTNVSN